MLVYGTDIGIYLQNQGKFKHLKFKRGEHTLEVEIEKINKLDKRNAWMDQVTQEKCWPVVQKHAKDLIDELEPYDKESGDKTAIRKRDAVVALAIQKFEVKLSDDLTKICRKIFNDYAKDQKDFKTYVRNGVIKIGINGAMLAASATLTGLGGWSGVGTVVGAVGMVRSAAQIGQQIGNFALDLAAIHKRLEANIAKMKKQLASPNIKANTAKQVAGTVVNKVFAVEIQSLVVTVDGLETDLALLLNKIRGVKREAVTLSAKIPKALDDQEKAIAEINELEGKLSKAGKPVSKTKKEAALKKLEADLHRSLEKISGMSKDMFEIERWAEKQHAEIAALKKKYNAKTVLVAGVATDLVISAGSFAAGNFAQPGQLIQQLHQQSQVVVNSLQLAQDGLGTIKDYAETIYEVATEG